MNQRLEIPLGKWCQFSVKRNQACQAEPKPEWHEPLTDAQRPVRDVELTVAKEKKKEKKNLSSAINCRHIHSIKIILQNSHLLYTGWSRKNTKTQLYLLIIFSQIIRWCWLVCLRVRGGLRREDVQILFKWFMFYQQQHKFTLGCNVENRNFIFLQILILLTQVRTGHVTLAAYSLCTSCLHVWTLYWYQGQTLRRL